MKLEKMGWPRGLLRCVIAMTVAAAWAGPTVAFNIDTGDPDWSVRWDNSFRVNAGWRVQGRDAALANSPITDEGDFKFNSGQMYTQRVDLLSELEVTWKKEFGFRLSGTAWYDHAYHDDSVQQNPTLASFGIPSSYAQNNNK
jgi:outer membrane protein assembly factor BamB